MITRVTVPLSRSAVSQFDKAQERSKRATASIADGPESDVPEEKSKDLGEGPAQGSLAAVACQYPVCSIYPQVADPNMAQAHSSYGAGCLLSGYKLQPSFKRCCPRSPFLLSSRAASRCLLVSGFLDLSVDT